MATDKTVDIQINTDRNITIPELFGLKDYLQRILGKVD
jgi:predicted nucleotidyltransferase